mmetsp:Transcript_66312/g.158217  ORF Transcript_66312/g.158217 Transcript_66312/m.158217 type:complete len:216 (-) Transcript_66312:882-1529(-)
MSGFAYTARARATRCFCPPERLMPRSPMAVWSPSGNTSRSERRAQASRTASYRSSWSIAAELVILSRNVALRIQAFCAQYPTVPVRHTLPSSGAMGSSPNMAYNNPDFPAPVFPRITISSPVFTEMSTSSSRTVLSGQANLEDFSSRAVPALAAPGRGATSGERRKASMRSLATAASMKKRAIIGMAPRGKERMLKRLNAVKAVAASKFLFCTSV